MTHITQRSATVFKLQGRSVLWRCCRANAWRIRDKKIVHHSAFMEALQRWMGLTQSGAMYDTSLLSLVVGPRKRCDPNSMDLEKQPCGRGASRLGIPSVVKCHSQMKRKLGKQQSPNRCAPLHAEKPHSRHFSLSKANHTSKRRNALFLLSFSYYE